MSEQVYTQDPDLLESDRLARPILMPEPGAYRGPTKGYRQLSPHHPCPACGLPTLEGMTEDGTRLTLDPETPIYTVYWRQRTPLPTFTESRGYALHVCGRHGG